MSGAGQPQNDDLSRDYGNRLRLPRRQRQVLAATAGELRADAELAALFSFFTTAASGTAMPGTERLPAWRPLAGWRRCLASLNRPIVLAVAVMVSFAAVVAVALALSWPGGQPIRCQPSYAFDPACPGPYRTPAGLEWQLQGPAVQPTYADGRQ